MKLTYAEHDDLLTRDKLFRLRLDDKRIQIGIRAELCHDDYQWQQAIRGARNYILQELGNILFKEGWDRG